MGFDIDKYKPLEVPRKEQADILPQIIESFEKKNKKYFILEAPTGIGKSFVAVALANYYADKKYDSDDLKNFRPGTFILLHQKILQDQYLKEKWIRINNNDLGYINNLKSSDNYFCRKLPRMGFTCAEVNAVRKKDADTEICSRDSCVYVKARREFILNKIGITNLQYFMNISSYTSLVDKKELMVLDECHALESQIMQFVSIDINEWIIKLRLRFDLPHFRNDAELLPWVKNELRPIVANKVLELENELEGLDINEENDRMGLKAKHNELDYWVRYKNKLDLAIEKVDDKNWIVDLTTTDKKGLRIYSFKPIIIDEYANKLLFDKANKILLMSGTILDKDSFCKSLGIDKDMAEFVSLPSPFPPEQRPIHILSVASLNKKDIDTNLPKIVEVINNLLSFHRDQKGIIHCHTYKIAEFIKTNVHKEFRRRLLTHTTKNRDDVLASHIQSSSPTVLLSPSMSEGIDLKDELSRFQILVKIPFPYLGDKRVLQKKKLQPWWYSYQTAKMIVQALGRSNRTEEDYSTSYILDSDWEFFYKINHKYFPEYFKICLQK